jgi:hypothetical protein
MGDWKPDKELALADDSDGDDFGLSHKFYLWIRSATQRKVMPPSDCEARV